MSNVDPQSAAEFMALERLRLAVLQYREEVGQLLQKRGLASTAPIPLVDLEDLPQEFALLAQTVKASMGSAAPVLEAPKPVALPPVVAPAVPVVVAPPVVAPPPVIPSPPMVPIASPLVSPAAKPQVAATMPQDEPDEFTGATQDFRVKTSPFAPLTPSQPIPQVRVEAGLPMRAPELIAELKTPLPLSMDAQSTPRVNLPAASPSTMRRPGMSPSMQVETLGSFLRRFRLSSE